MSRSIFICGETVTLEQFIASFDKYLPMVQSHFRRTTLCKRDSMPDNEFAALLFNRLRRKPYFSIQQDFIKETRILEALGISVVSYKPCASTLVFKGSSNTYHIKNDNLTKLIESVKKRISYNKKNLNPAFGIEIEFIGNADRRREFNQSMRNLLGDRYTDLGYYNKNSGGKWILGRDSTVRPASNSFSGYELTSPIFHLNDSDLNEIKSVLDLIKNVFDGTVNRSCGTHVHLSFDSDEDISAHFLKHIARSYARNESNLFDRLVPPSRREDKCRWCRHTSVIHYNRSRYQKLNFLNVDFDSNNIHLEFRQLNGTLDFEKINSWLKLQRLFIEIAYNSYNSQHTELKDCISDVVKMPIEEVICCDEFTVDERESLLKESKLIS